MTPAIHRWPRRLPLTALILFQATVIAGKLAVSIMTWARFGRQLHPLDVAVTFGIDSALTLAALALLLLLYGLGGRLSRLPMFQEGLLRRASSVTGIIFDAVTTVFILFTTGLYLMSVYVFWEWGAFLEPQHYIAMDKARVTSGILFVITRPLALVPIAILGGCIVGGWLLHYRSRSWSRAVLSAVFVSATLSLGALVPALSQGDLEPSTLSPVVGFFSPRNLERTTDGLPPNITQPDLTGFSVMPIPREPQPRFESLEGAATGMDLVIVILESVRADNLAVYGYERETTPTISRLAKNGLVFHDAYVNQPRSSKSLLSMTMGVWPDPRMVAKIWDEERFRGKESFVSRLQSAGYGFYFGMTADRRNDHFGAYMRVISGPEAPVVGGQDIGIDEMHSTLFPRDDKLLVQNFLGWAGGEEGPISAMLWFDTAHFPYKALYSRFTPEETMVDRYDNCLYSSDMALHRLIEGLRKLGRLDNTLIVVFGDHGEALGEHLDVAHGSFLYEHSVRFPLLIHNTRIWPERVDLTERMEMKDLPATLFYLLGLPTEMRQSEIVFAKSPTDRVYMSNVYQDFKLGMITGDGIKYVFQPRMGMQYVFDTKVDPKETVNRSGEFQEEIPGWRDDVVRWYYAQLTYIESEFPPVDSSTDVVNAQ